MQPPKIGLEIHGYLNMQETKQKLFCLDRIDQTAQPNTNICPICTSQPGCKPMLPNKEAVDKIIAIASMIGCKINKRLLFQRKHYSWPDLPAGYQRTISGAYSTPVGQTGSFFNIGITECHLEEDPAKWDPSTGTIDYNRSGYPLVEIVTDPDFTSSDQVREWLKKLMTILSYIKAIDKEAGIKADVNVSIYPEYQRVEIKNVNSFKSIVNAIEYEIQRQKTAQENKEKIGNETRAWDDTKGITIKMRSKETQADYMFIPEPDLPSINLEKEYIENITKILPEKPAEKIKKFIKKGISQIDAEIMASEIILAELFEKITKEINPLLAAKWLRRELMRVVHYNKLELDDIKIDEKHLIQLLKLIETNKITDTTAQKILEKLIIKPFDVNDYVKKQGISKVEKTSDLEDFCKQAIKENQQAVEDYKSGEDKALHFIVGQVMRKTKGTAEPEVVRLLILKLMK